MTTSDHQCIDLHIGIVDLDTGEIVGRDGRPIEMLAPRPLGVLRFLVARRGDAVSRDDLLEGVWGHLEAGSEDSVNVAISSLRRVLDDQKRPYRVIQTLPRRGYRYAGPEPAAKPALPAAGEGPVQARRTWRRPWLVPVAVPVVLLVAAAVAFWLPNGRESTVRAKLRDAPVGTLDDSIEPPVLPRDPGIAVLPFQDLSMEGDQGAFADALVDSILHMLAQIPDLRVVARTSSFAFKGKQADIEEIAARLRVTAVLEGSVQRASDRIRVTAQLVDDEGAHIWSRVYEREAGDLFDIQDDIAAAVSRELQFSLVPTASPPGNLAAFEQIARGWNALRQDTFESAVDAQAFFERALELAPDSVDATIGLARAMAQEARLGGYGNDRPGFQRYEALIERAYEMAPDDPRAVKIRGDLAFTLGNREAAETLFRRATELGPSYVDAWTSLGRTLWRRGAFDEALDTLRVAHDLDPLSDMVNAMLADAYWSVGRAEEAMARLRENIERNPDFARYYDRMATYLSQIGQTGDAMRYIQVPRRLDPDSGRRWFRACEFHNQLGDPDAAEACVDGLEAAHGMPDWVLYLRQQIAGLRGDWARSRELLLQLREQAPEMELIPVLAAMSHASVDCDAALAPLEAAYPEFFADPPGLEPIYVMGAEFAVHCLQEVGRETQAEALLSAVEKTVERMRLMRAPHYVSGLEGVVLLALQGRHDEALTAFERAVDSGWRYYWWGLDQYPMLDPIREHPRFKAALERLREGVEAQREYWEQHRDVPLVPGNARPDPEVGSSGPEIRPRSADALASV